jgi:hypothetical protein
MVCVVHYKYNGYCAVVRTAGFDAVILDISILHVLNLPVLFQLPAPLLAPCSRSTHNPGVSLTELARLMLQRSELNVLFAINLDGGGSTTLVHHHLIRNRPRCLDVDFVPCERRVASVVCLAIPVEELELEAV